MDGSSDCVVLYDQMFFAMADDRKMHLFLKSPWCFHSLPPPPEEGRPSKTPLNKYSVMPAAENHMCRASIEEYLQRTVSSAVSSAIQRIVDIRPKYPYVGGTESVLKGVALHLKGTTE